MTPDAATAPEGVFYWVVPCPACGADSHHGLCLTTLRHKGYPAIPVDMGAQDAYRCAECGRTVYAAELELYVEDDDEDQDA